MKWWKTLKEYISNPYEPEEASVTIKIMKGSNTPVVDVVCKPGAEAALSQILFELSEGHYFSDAYAQVAGNLSASDLSAVNTYIQFMENTKTALQQQLNTDERPVVLPSQVFAGVQNAQANS